MSRFEYPAASGAVAQDRTRQLLGQVMGLVAATTMVAAAGAYAGRNITPGLGFVFFIGGFVCIFGLRAARANRALSIGLLLGMGLLLGVGSGPTLERYSHLQNGSTLIAQAAGATALFIAGFGAYGYATRRDLSHWARTLFFALLGLIGFGLVAIFVRIPHAQQIYAVVGLGIFSAYTMFDFNRLRRSSDADAVFIAASIFLDILNVFFLMLSLMGGGRRS
jgi:FtsH-binding integral membrane protein